MAAFAANGKRALLSAAAALVCTASANGAAPTPDFGPKSDIGWIATSVDYIPAPTGPKPILDDPAHPYVPNGRSEQATFRISNVNHPNLKPWAVEVMKKDNAEVLAGKIAYTARSSCKPSGVPDFMAFIVEPIYFIHTPKEILMIYSGDAQTRHIYMNVSHTKNPSPSWYGESVGHWEGTTLVIDTIGMNTKSFVDNYRTPHTERLHVVERWTRSQDGKTLELIFNVDDPDTFKEPWSAIQRYRQVERPFIEQACAENNSAMFDYHIPVADKPDF
jgi:hypothetical protein